MTIKIGDTIAKRKVTGIKEIIHGPLYPNRNITHIIALRGPRGGQVIAHLERSGRVSGFVTGGFGYFEGMQVLDGR